MNIFRLTLIIVSANLLNSCVVGQKSTASFVLPPQEFEMKLSNTESPVIIDVRSPKEYSTGHLSNSKNINWNDDNFTKEIAVIDKSQPVFVYCLSGGRSHDAAEQMRANGFKEVYEMDGGLLKWRSAGLSESAPAAKVNPKGLSKDEFNKLLESDKLVLVDFYAKWCGPCKKMKPYLEEVENTMSDKVKVVRIDIDENPGLARLMKIDAIPVIQFYRENKLTWSNVGYLDKKGLWKELKNEGIKQ